MKITITTMNDLIVTLEVSPDMELENFKALCESEVNIPAESMVVSHDGVPMLNDKQNLGSYGIREGDVVFVQAMFRRNTQNSQLPNLGIDFSSIVVPGNSSSDTTPAATTPSSNPPPAGGTRREQQADAIWQELAAFPDRLTLLRQNNPRLADAFQAGDRDAFLAVLSAQLDEKSERERKRIRMMNADPFDPEAQKLIAEEIRQDNVNSNMEAAIEFHPESFGQVTMLYVDCRVNGHRVRAFVDSGAQSTIMSKGCAERCGIMRLVDTRWQGVAKGVGVQRIMGKVHLGQIEINNAFLQSSFFILEDQSEDMLFGLDMLRRHQCCIDLKRNVLVIGTTGQETPFLLESELPRSATEMPVTLEELSELGWSEDKPK